MSWRFEYFKTNSTTAAVSAQQNVNVIADFTLTKSVGDEAVIKSGDLQLTMRAPLPFDATANNTNWLAVYFNGTLYDVFLIGDANSYNRSYGIFDENSKLYKTRLESLQQTFYRHLKSTKIVYSTVSTDWSLNLADAKTFIVSIKVKDGNGGDQTSSSTVGWSISEMIKSLQGTNGYGYQIAPGTIYNTMDLFTANDLPVIYRGLSLISSSTNQQVIEQSFSDDETHWIDIVRIFLFAYNAFLASTPTISGGVLKLNFEAKPKINITSTTSATLTWSERQYERHKNRIDGVKLSGKNFEFTQGNFESGDIFNANIPVFDPSVDNGDYAKSLYWSKGINYNIVFNQYDILDGAGTILPYNSSGLIEPYYAPFISAGHAYQGTIFFNNEQLLTEYLVGSDKIQLNNIVVGNDGMAEVEGIVVS